MWHKNYGLLLVLTLPFVMVACHKRDAPPLTLEECDPAGYVPCVQQSAFLSIPIADTNLRLTYSSRWKNRKTEKANWDAQGLGLGGWSINLVQRYDPANRLLIGGDGSWRVVDAVKLPSGELAVPSYDGRLAFIFASDGRHVRTVDGHLGTVLLKITYDNFGRLSQVDGFSNSQRVHVSVQRTANGAPLALVGIDGGATLLALDSRGHLVRLMNPVGETTRITWNPAGLIESKTDPAGGVERFTYDSSGQLTSKTDPDDVTRRYERKQSGDILEIKISTALGQKQIYRAESARGAIRRTFIQADGTETTQATDDHGNSTLKLPDGTTWKIGLAANPVWGMAAPILSPITEARSDGVNSRRETKYNLQSQGGLPYILAGSVTTIINGQPWTQNFDPAHHTQDLVDPAGRRTVLRYDEKGRILSYAPPGRAPVSYSYSPEDRMTSVTLGSGKLARTIRYGYDASTGEIITTRPDGTVEKTAVDRAGRVAVASSSDGATVVLGHDSAGRLNRVQPPGGLSFTIGMSPAGRLTAFAPPMVEGDGSIETRFYDKDGRLTAISGMGNRAINYSYDSAGRLTTYTFDQGKRSFSYDGRSGQLIQSSDPSGVNTSYLYAGGMPAGVTWSGPVNGAVALTFDANGLPVRQSVDNGNTLDFTYDAEGNLTGVGPLALTRDPASGLVTRTSLGIVETSRQFDDNLQLIRSTTTASGKVLLDLRYARDPMGRITAVTETIGQGTPIRTDYSFDRSDQLAAVRVNGRTVETALYDPAGDRTVVQGPHGLTKASYDNRQRILTFGKAQYQWEPDGALKLRAEGPHATSFIYDDFGALRQAKLPDGREIKYLVDADGRRIGREANGKLVSGYLYNLDGSLAAETDGAGKIISRFGYDAAGHLALVERGGTTYRVITDSVGSPLLIIDSRTGSIAEQLAYDAWGNVTQDTAPGFIPISFAGGLRDFDTGLILFGVRDYDPETGRWTAADPIRFDGGDVNLYRYASGDPVNESDPSGLKSLTDLFHETPGYDLLRESPGYKVYQYLNDKWGNDSQNTNPPQNTDPPQNTSPSDGNSSQWSYCIAPYSYACFNPPNANLTPLTNPSGNADPGNTSPIDPLTPYTNPSGKTGTPFTKSSPSSSPDDTWDCFQATGMCGGTDGYGCYGGGCGVGQNGFYCYAQRCYGPNGDLCSAAPGQSCSVGLDSPDQGEGSGGGGGGGNGGGGGGNGGGGGGGGGGGNGGGGNGGGGGGGGNGGGGGGNGGGAGNGGGGNGGGGGGGGGNGGNGGGGGGGGGEGEPHLYTLGGARFDFQVVGEFLVLSSPDGKHAVQARQEPWGTVVTINTAVAANVDGDRVGVYVKEPAFLTVNGVPVQAADMEKRLPHGGTLQRHGGEVVLYWRDGSRLKITQAANLLNYHFSPSARTAKMYTGLLGGTGGTNTIVGLDKSSVSLSDPEFANKLYKKVGNSWRIKSSESLFHYWPGESTAKFTNLDFPPKYVTVASLASSERSKAESICRALGVRNQPILDNCILDVGITGVPALATASVGVRPPSVWSTTASASYTPPASPSRSAPDHYAINIGDTVSPGHPAAGAGVVSSAGEKQYYSFSVPASADVYIHVGPCEGAVPSFELRQLNDKTIGGRIGCGDFGPFMLSTPGAYQVVVSADKSPAKYSFSLRSTAFDHYSIKIGQTVSPDHPGPGAGIIKDKGQKQSYSFDGNAGETVFVGLGPCEGANPSFNILKPDNTLLTGAIENCHVSFRETLPVTGTYQIVANTDPAAPASRYGFFVHNVPPDQHFAIHLPVAVSPNTPARGAGHVSAPGAEQFYDFVARPGTVVHIEGKCSTPCPNLVIRVAEVNDASSYGYWDLSSVKNDWTVPPSGKYSIQVRSNGYVGDYSFTASQVEARRR